MKKVLLTTALSVSLLSAVAFAAPYWATKPIQCSTQEELIDMAKGLGELPTVIFEGSTIGATGQASPSKFVISTNEKTKTWTLMEFPDGGKQGCILGSGTGEIKIQEHGIKT